MLNYLFLRNLFLTREDRIKIGDLGCARHKITHENINSFAGTIPYISPEVFEQQNYSFTTDIWLN